METICIKRAYDYRKGDEGYRVLIDRLWPRGIMKSVLDLDEWNKEIAPSTALRKWFNHEEERFGEFGNLYRQELEQKESELKKLLTIAKKQHLTLLYAAKNEKINHAVILRKVLMEKL